MHVFKNSLLIISVFLLLASFTPLAHATFDPSQVSGLQLWLDGRYGVYKDAGKTQPATTTNDLIAVWADQSGNGNDATQTTVGNQPKYTLAATGGQPAITFRGLFQGWLTLGNPSSINFNASPSAYTIFVVYQRTSGTTQQSLLNKSNNGGVTSEIFNVHDSQVDQYQTIPSRSSNNDTQANILTNTFTPVSGAGANGYETLSLNGGLTSVFRGSVARDTTSNWHIGAWGNNGFINGFVGKIQAVLMYNRVLTISEQQTMESYLAATFGGTVATDSLPTESPTAQVIYDGDSITAGQGNTTNESSSFTWVVQNSLSSYYRNYNFGLSGQPTSDMTLNAPTKIDPLVSSNYSKNILVGWEGTNDLSNFGLSAQQTYDGLVNYYKARRAAGWKVVAVTILPRDASFTVPETGAQFEIDRQAVNALMRQNWPQFADALADVASDPTIGQSGQSDNATYYLGAIHPTAAGNLLLAPYFTSAIQSIINTSDPVVGTAPISSPGSDNANFYAGWKYAIMAGPHFVGTPSFIRSSNYGQNAATLIANTAHHDDMYIHITRVLPMDLLQVTPPIAFPWMQGFNTVSEIYQFQAYSAFNGYPIQQFDHPVTILLPYTSNAFNNKNDTTLAIITFNQQKQRWETLNSPLVIDSFAHTIAATTKQFSYFAVGYWRGQ